MNPVDPVDSSAVPKVGPIEEFEQIDQFFPIPENDPAPRKVGGGDYPTAETIFKEP